MENLDVRTCEQYVLTVLEATLEANNDLVLENRLLETRIKQLESQLNAKPSRLEEYVNSYGRQKLFEDLTYSGWDTKTRSTATANKFPSVSGGKNACATTGDQNGSAPQSSSTSSNRSSARNTRKLPAKSKNKEPDCSRGGENHHP